MKSPESAGNDDNLVELFSQALVADGLIVETKKSTAAMPAGVDSRQVTITGKLIDLTKFHADELPSLLIFDGTVRLSRSQIDMLHASQDFRSLEFRGPIEVTGASELTAVEKQGLIEKVESMNGGDIHHPEAITFV